MNTKSYPGTVSWEIPGFTPYATPGEPAIPGFVDSFVVPIGSDPQVQLLSSSYMDFDYDIAPARMPLSERDTVGYITGEKQSISVLCNGGLMTASLMINGYPVSSVKIYVQ